jgi:hypothetical protein
MLRNRRAVERKVRHYRGRPRSRTSVDLPFERSYEHPLERVSLTQKSDLQGLLQVHILELELVKLR